MDGKVLLRKRNSCPVEDKDDEHLCDAKRDKKEEEEEEINVVDNSDSDSDIDCEQPETSSKAQVFLSSENKLGDSVRTIRDSPVFVVRCGERPLDLSKKAKCDPLNSHINANSDSPPPTGSTYAVNNVDCRKSPSPFVLNQIRPSVIKSADICFDQELPDVDEHFRKSLGSRAAPSEEEAKVDDHFARALGSTWWTLKKREASCNEFDNCGSLPVENQIVSKARVSSS